MSADSERYSVPGTSIFNFTAWSRENELKPPPTFWVRHPVIYTNEEHGELEGYVNVVYPDCDCTVLYDVRVPSLDLTFRGVPEESLAAPPRSDEGSPE